MGDVFEKVWEYAHESARDNFSICYQEKLSEHGSRARAFVACFYPAKDEIDIWLRDRTNNLLDAIDQDLREMESDLWEAYEFDQMH